MTDARFSARDLDDLDRRGISREQAHQQIERLRGPRAYAALVRPSTPADGILRIERAEIPALHELQGRAAAEGRWQKFVPASGAASRMFRDLHVFWNGDRAATPLGELRRQALGQDEAAAAVVRFVDERARFAFHSALIRTPALRDRDVAALLRRGEYRPLLEALLSPEGLDYDRRPKGLLLFHGQGEAARTPFEEHLAEGAAYVKDSRDVCRVHFTVSEEHRELFGELLARIREPLSRRCEAVFVVGTSVQDPSTDTLALEATGAPLRDAAGRLQLRPGGHGALIHNIQALGADLLFVKNIDNVQPDERRGPTLEWKRTLGGLLLRLQQELFEHLRRLEASGAADDLQAAERFLRQQLRVEPPQGYGTLPPQQRRTALVGLLERPLRVCGVVPNTGEPGGGPFWVRDAEGCVRSQIVEAAQVDPGNAEQQAILRSSTHFNPVDLACAVRDRHGRPFDLARHVDPQAAIVTSKSVDGRPVRVLEWPGLWNGAMAGWNTVFVEVPLETFSPVKTVLDLLRPEHQPPASPASISAAPGRKGAG